LGTQTTKQLKQIKHKTQAALVILSISALVYNRQNQGDSYEKLTVANNVNAIKKQ